MFKEFILQKHPFMNVLIFVTNIAFGMSTADNLTILGRYWVVCGQM